MDSFENIRLIKYYKAENFESNRLFRVLENYQVCAHSQHNYIKHKLNYFYLGYRKRSQENLVDIEFVSKFDCKHKLDARFDLH